MTSRASTERMADCSICCGALFAEPRRWEIVVRITPGISVAYEYTTCSEACAVELRGTAARRGSELVEVGR